MAEPITTALSLASTAKSLAGLFGGSGGTPAVPQAWQVTGTINEGGFSGAINAQLNTGSIPAPEKPGLFSEIVRAEVAKLGRAVKFSAPVSFSAPYEGNYNPTLAERMRQVVRAALGAAADPVQSLFSSVGAAMQAPTMNAPVPAGTPITSGSSGAVPVVAAGAAPGVPVNVVLIAAAALAAWWIIKKG